MKLLFFIGSIFLTASAFAGTAQVIQFKQTTATLTGRTTVYYDTFTEASDLTNLTLHTIDNRPTGATWTGDNVSDGNLKITAATDNLSPANDTDWWGMYTSSNITSADQCSSVDFTNGTDSGAEGNIWIRNDVSQGFYYGQGPADKWYIYRDAVLKASGTITSVVGSYSNTTAYSHKVCATGSSWVYTINGTNAVSFTDTTFQTVPGVTGGFWYRSSFIVDNLLVTVP